ncbi:MAG: hypothetical protein R3255_06955 [Candidatus Lokiarchaeia archaeon]|nr:hypothetical protein [Candidatus Lokiarchaeia archaeon]
MSEERRIDAFAIIILIISLVGLILMFATDFTGFYYGGYGVRYSCLTGCEYSTPTDLTMQIFMVILLIAQIVWSINELLPEKFLPFKNLNLIGLILAASTALFAVIGIAAFGITWGLLGGYDWWAEAGFYGGFLAGIINAVFYFLRFKKII